MTPGRSAFLQLVGVLLASGLLRAGCAPRLPPEDALPGRVVDPRALVDSAAMLAQDESHRSRPLGPGERLDPNRAPEAELDRLPGVGPGLARAIMAARDTLPFRSVDDLERVRGIGPSTLEKLRSGLKVVERGGGSAVGSRAPGGLGRGGGAGTGSRLDLNRASAAELESLSGVGPVLAERIVAERSRRGGFRSVDELTAVRGVGPALLEGLRDHLRTGPGR